ncbi:hypothetical protein BKI52_35475 [marine bacterium AO1-C]|nr:hypothetical protein BKI52_35475 [marine bacterium AO1-C]
MIGIDIGRVIISGDTDIPNQFFSEDYLSVSPVTQAFMAIQQIVETYTPQNVHLVSKCGEQTQQRTLQWLTHHQFFEKTGVIPTQVWFCRERHEKRSICEAQNIRTFIDDRFTVLQHLLELDQLFLFRPSEEELEAFENANSPDKVRLVDGWEALLKKLT